MKIQVKKVYYCEFCNKHSLSAGSLSRHEKYCKNNPANAHKCFEFCRHLHRTKEPFHNGGGEIVGSRKYFECLVTGIQLYSFHLEKRSSLHPYSNITKGLTRMPLECDKYKEMDIDKMDGSYVKD
jgi:hypothetical protein